MDFAYLLKWEAALDEAQKIDKKDGINEFYAKLLPTAIDCVTEWHIGGLPDKVTPTNFPASARLLAWLCESITKLYETTNEEPTPKEDGPSLTS